MDLVRFARSIREFGPLKRKAILPKVMETLAAARVPREHVFADFGEDSAAIDLNSDSFGLIAADGIIPEFVQANPHGAGYAAILVCVDDIYTCGGTPLATSIVISARDEAEIDEILAGVNEGSEKFQVPVVRGHTHPDASVPSISSSMFGIVPKQDFVPAGGARPGNILLAIVDPNGRRSPYNPLTWDTTTMKSSDTVIAMRRAFQQLAAQHLIISAKDISNAGLFGTLLQMLELSQCGGIVDLDAFSVPLLMQENKVTLLEFAEMFLASSFISCAPASSLPAIKEILEPVQYEVLCIGETVEEKTISLVYNGKTEILFDYREQNIITPRLPDRKYENAGY